VTTPDPKTLLVRNGAVVSSEKAPDPHASPRTPLGIKSLVIGRDSYGNAKAAFIASAISAAG
jgi:hypothetical protein